MGKNTKDFVSFKVPRAIVGDVQYLVSDYKARQNPKPIKRLVRVPADEIMLLKDMIAQRNKLGRQIDKILDKVDREVERLDNLYDTPVSKSDKLWIQKQLNKLDRLQDLLDD